MENTKILSAPLIDIIFDGRNKEYGAYALRKTYAKRMSIALFVLVVIVAFAFAGAALGRPAKKISNRLIIHNQIILSEVSVPRRQDPPPVQKKKTEQKKVRVKKFTPPVITKDVKVKEPVPEIAEFENAQIGTENQSGEPDKNVESTSENQTQGTGILNEKPVERGNDILTVVEVPARFRGDWVKFLLKNLDARVPVDQGAAGGTYSVVVQFVVDAEGKVSDVKALTHHGYGLEEEAIRVIRKATLWDPAIQNGYKVKAYHRQIITFLVREE